MKLVQSKSILAKLMATENIIVEQRKVRTASFDVANRILTIPILDDNMCPELYDLFMGHEVGHALFTPEQLLKQCQEQNLTFSVMNVIEDARIERKMKAKYPGLKQPFIIGYKDLVDREFFEIDKEDLDSLNFIDRANMYFKLGVASGIEFINNTEQDLVEEIFGCETIEDVLITTRNVMDYLTEEYKQKSQDSGTETESESETETETESETDNALRKNQSQLFSDDNMEYFYGNIPDINAKRIIVSRYKVWGEYQYHQEVVHPEYTTYSIMQNSANELFQSFRLESKKVVSYLVKEFEMKKNAQQLKRASVAKTGEINMDAVYSYKFAEDVFKKLTVVPNGKSHGLVLFLDWSGSMEEHLHNTVKQLLNLVMFCKQVNIPYEVYAFTDRYADVQQLAVDGDLEMFSGVNMLNMLSNKMTTKEFNFAVRSLLDISKNINKYNYVPYILSLGSTPLNAAIVAAMQVVPNFKKEYTLEIVNTVFLTDGDSNSSYKVHYTDHNGIARIGVNREYDTFCGKSTHCLIIRDPKTKYQETIKNIFDDRKTTSAFLRMLKYTTQCNVIGFYVVDKRNTSVLVNMFPPSKHNAVKADFKKNNYQIVTTEGYDEYYLLRAQGLNIDNEELTIKENATTRGVVSSFAKFTKNRTNNRVILNQFIKMII